MTIKQQTLMQKSDYTIATISRKDFVQLCNSFGCSLLFLRKNNNKNTYEVRIKIIKSLDLSDIEKTSIEEIFKKSFEYIENDSANLAEIASYIKMRRASNCLKRKLKSINFEEEIRSSEAEIDLKINELKDHLSKLECDKKYLEQANDQKIYRIKHFIK